MSTDLTVEGIVAQIRKRIAEESAHGSNRQPINSSPVAIPTQPDYRERMAEDSRRFTDLELQIEAAAAKIGGKPPVPPTWRGRFGSWVIDLLRRLLWWYAAPIQDTVDLLNRRNREQAARHLQLQEQVLSLMNGLQQVSQRTQTLETSEREAAGRENENRIFLQQMQRQVQELEGIWPGIRSQVSALAEQVSALAEQVTKLDINRVAERLTHKLEELRESRIQREQNLKRQIDELKGSVQEMRASSAASDVLRTELEQRVSEATRMEWGRLPVVETQLHVEAEAREALALEINAHVARLERKINDGVGGVAGRASQLALAQEKQRSDLLVQEHRISMFLREVRSRLPEALSETQVRQMTGDPKDSIASLYADFEDVFRGPREEIKERLKVYLPRLVEAKVGSPQAPVLDLGCGRGEWLQLLSERGLTGRGVDSNPIMIGRCAELGIEVLQGDALAHLRSRPDKSLGAISSFHMIEHLPFETVMAIIDEALRVLQSGGLLILETPNPQNALVGSQTFWIDPTHLRPIPSQTLRFFVEARGFCQVEILNLQPYSEAVHVPENGGAVAQRFNEYFYGPQDYSVIGRRP